MSAKRKVSCVWAYYTEETGTPYATCSSCLSQIKRGKDGDKASWSSKPLWNHLQKRHPAEYTEACGNRKKEDAETAKRRKIEEEKKAIYVNGTPKLQDFLSKKAKYVPDNPEQRELSNLLSTWIADGVLPYETIDNSRYYIVMRCFKCIL